MAINRRKPGGPAPRRRSWGNSPASDYAGFDYDPPSGGSDDSSDYSRGSDDSSSSSSSDSCSSSD